MKTVITISFLARYPMLDDTTLFFFVDNIVYVFIVAAAMKLGFSTRSVKERDKNVTWWSRILIFNLSHPDTDGPASNAHPSCGWQLKLQWIITKWYTMLLRDLKIMCHSSAHANLRGKKAILGFVHSLRRLTCYCARLFFFFCEFLACAIKCGLIATRDFPLF